MRKRTSSRFLRLLIRRQSYLLFDAQVDEIVSLMAADDAQFEILSALNIAENRGLTDMLLELNPDNRPYLLDIKEDRIVGLAISENGRPVHYSYLFKKNKTACLLGLPVSTALIGNAFTVPHRRGRGLQVKSVLARAAIARANGFAAIAAETDPGNRSSQRGLYKSGMKLRGRIDLVIMLNCVVIRWRRPTGISLFGFCR